MTGYLINFSIYTLAMIGIIFAALYAFKVFSSKCFTKKSSMLEIEDKMNLSQRKTLYVVNVKNEKFLIAADAERTSLIAKLEPTASVNLVDLVEKKEIAPIREDKSTKLKSFDGLKSIDEFTSVIDFKRELDRPPVMRELAKKLTYM